MRNLACHALDALVEHHLASRELAAATRNLERYASLQPLDSDVPQILIRTYSSRVTAARRSAATPPSAGGSSTSSERSRNSGSLTSPSDPSRARTVSDRSRAYENRDFGRWRDRLRRLTRREKLPTQVALF